MKKLRFDPLIAIFFFKSGVLCACVLSGATVTVCEWGGGRNKPDSSSTCVRIRAQGRVETLKSAECFRMKQT